MKREFLRASDIASAIGVSTGRVYQLISAGEMPAIRRGRAIWIPRPTWEAWLQAQSAAVSGTDTERKEEDAYAETETVAIATGTASSII